MTVVAIVAIVAVVAVVAAIAKDSANQISKVVGILPNAVRTLLSYHLGPAQLLLLFGQSERKLAVTKGFKPLPSLALTIERKGSTQAANHTAR